MTPTLFAHPSPPAVEARRLRLFVLGLGWPLQEGPNERNKKYKTVGRRQTGRPDTDHLARHRLRASLPPPSGGVRQGRLRF
jgi:hypothetical protein